MTTLAFALIVAVGSFAAGLLGALTGLGGGIVVVPMLTLVFHVDLRYAIGASLISVIGTSSGSAAAYVREGFTNVRVGIVLEVATTIGALIGAAIAGFISTSVLSMLFGVVLLFSAYRSIQPREEHAVLTTPDKWSALLKLDSTYPTPKGEQAYSVQHAPAGFLLMFIAGILSALLGIGSGIIKVLAMDQVMRLPFKVSTTTSNFMIGVTAAASAGVFLHRGQIDPTIAFPVMLGVLGGALLGARILSRANTKALRQVFTVVVVVGALEMLYKGATGAM
ncbi:MAG TPA: sulfite exporter TauE/SafE family protein [Gemmatimonadaceae bacterium]|nr:sulfite exporter TauE/SafE family protein [Gemmatimonadaceae bacterium]